MMENKGFVNSYRTLLWGWGFYIRAMLPLCYQRFKQPSMDPTFPLVPIVNFGACLLIFLSISKNMFQSWNVGACSFAVWTAIVSFYIGLNSIIWSNNIANIAPAWCDISEYSISFEKCLFLITAISNTSWHWFWISYQCIVFCDHPKTISRGSSEERHCI